MKLIAIDLDGTLLDTNHQLSDKNKAAVRRAHDAGIIIVIATGRSLFSVKEIFADLAIDGYMIALNGSFIAKIDKRQQVTKLFRERVDRKKLIQAFEIAMEHQITFIATNELGSDRVLIEDGNELVQEFLVNRPDLRNRQINEMASLLSKRFNEYLKAAFTNKDRERLIGLRGSLQEKGIDTIFSDTYYIEFLPCGVNKGTALGRLCEYIQLPLSETAAFGDQENDIEMLQMSGVGLAMGNAQPSVKAAADRIITDNDHSGVADGILNFLLKE